ncbi:ciliary microtubule inner protein 1 isoform 1-T1 [Anomaloglossus baeobatrachus]|uniref:ciliary microtubule inner protein 1 isoform X1 n=1 Tax=Anomaloglossus baeobatrachus TaxID=238106 RepID=UPI003F50B76C
MAAAPQHQGKHSNLVAQDMIWKAHVKKEQETTKMWPDNWGFLTASYNEPRTESAMKAKEVAQRIKVPDHMKVRTVTPLDQYIKVGQSPAIPQTTQGLIGWRSTVSALQLERYGRTRHLKGDFCKNMNWPAEGIA